MQNMQFFIESEQKMAFARDAVSLGLPMSVLLRRLVEVYLNDPKVRQRVINFNNHSWEDAF